jgi:nitroimidazol reductase NimA-like FMN-containing flavoprotein (pyridoxamine 5'-phosphate oxidase superfamily)
VTELPADVRTLFDGPNYAHIATLLPDGAPHSVPVWVGLEGERIVFLTSPTSRKARNLERDPRIAVRDLRPECVVDGLLESHRTPLG